MRTLFVLILSCLSALGADLGIQTFSSSKTNAAGRISTKEVFTRGGQTNLVRNTSTRSGLVLIQVYRFYHDGSLVGFMTTSPNSSSTTTEAGSLYSLDFEYGPSNQLKCVAISGKDGVLVDMFSCTNGVLSPIDSSQLQAAVGGGADAKDLISNARKLSPEEFNGKVEQLLEKHGGK